MTYTSSFTIGSSDSDYESLTVWHGAVRDAIDDGDNWLVTLNPSDGEIFEWTNLNSWGNADVDWELTISGSMTPGDYDTYAIRNSNFAALFSNNGGNKKINLVGLSLVPSSTGSTIMYRMTGGSGTVGEGNVDFLISSCQIDSTAGGSNKIFEDRKTNMSSVYSYTLANSTYRGGSNFFQGLQSLTAPYFFDLNLLGCTIDVSSSHFTSITSNSNLFARGSLSGSLFISNSFRKLMDVNANPNTSLSAVDFITSELESTVNGWIGYSSNFTFLNSDGSQWKFGSAPSEGEVAFSGARTSPGSYGNDYRLWDSANNLASGYVATASMPALDITGGGRGTSPFDAGAFEIDVEIGGGQDFPPESGGTALPLTFAYRLNLN